MAFTNVTIIARNCTYSAAAILDEADAATLAGLVNDALDGVGDLSFSEVGLQCSRDDDTPGA